MGLFSKKEKCEAGKRRIAFVSASPGAGASTILQLAAEYASFELKTDTSVVELGRAHFSAVFNFEEKFLNGSFSCQKDLTDETSAKKNNMYKGINWVVKRLKDKPLDISFCYKLLYKLAGNVVLFDCSGMDRDMLFELLPNFDDIVFVVDPRPSAIIENFDFIERMMLAFPGIKLVINKSNKAVGKQRMDKIFGRRDFMFFDSFDTEIVYKQEHNCAMFYEIWGDCSLIKTIAKSIII